MKCDRCKEDKCFWTDLFWNGRYEHFDTFRRIRNKKVYWCEKCMSIKEVKYKVSRNTISRILRKVGINVWELT